MNSEAVSDKVILESLTIVKNRPNKINDKFQIESLSVDVIMFRRIVANSFGFWFII